jgi:ferredoxin
VSGLRLAKHEMQEDLMAKLVIINSAQSFEFLAGTKLADIFSEADCGVDIGCGAGACGSCKIVSKMGGLSPLTEREMNFLDKTEIESGIRLACQCVLVEDAEIQCI